MIKHRLHAIWVANSNPADRCIVSQMVKRHGEVIDDADYPVPKKWCPPLEHDRYGHAGVMIHCAN